MKRVTGIGGIFFKAENKIELLQWYRDHLGIPVADEGYASFRLSGLYFRRIRVTSSQARRRS